MSDQTPKYACEWFALCDHEAIGLVAHPAFPGGVPTCQRCVDRFDMTVEPLPVAGVDYDVSVCANCGEDEHTPAQLAACIESMVGPSIFTED